MCAGEFFIHTWHDHQCHHQHSLMSRVLCGLRPLGWWFRPDQSGPLGSLGGPPKLASGPSRRPSAAKDFSRLLPRLTMHSAYGRCNLAAHVSILPQSPLKQHFWRTLPHCSRCERGPREFTPVGPGCRGAGYLDRSRTPSEHRPARRGLTPQEKLSTFSGSASMHSLTKLQTFGYDD